MEKPSKTQTLKDCSGSLTEYNSLLEAMAKLEEDTRVIVYERDMLTKVVDVLQEELKICRDEKLSVKNSLSDLEQKFEKMCQIIEDLFAAQLKLSTQLDSNPNPD